jgi:uncharacterized protein
MAGANRVICAGERTYPCQHPLTPEIEREIAIILGDSFHVSFTEHYETWDAAKLAEFALVITCSDLWADRTAGEPGLAGQVVKYVVNGGSMLVLHAALAMGSRPECYILAQMAGGALLDRPRFGSCEFFAFDEAHPITKGLGPFSIEEEAFHPCVDRFAERTMLFRMRHQNTWVPGGWAIEFGLGRLVFLAPGFAVATFMNETFRKLLKNSSLWAVGGKVEV